MEKPVGFNKSYFREKIRVELSITKTRIYFSIKVINRLENYTKKISSSILVLEAGTLYL